MVIGSPSLTSGLSPRPLPREGGERKAVRDYQKDSYRVWSLGSWIRLGYIYLAGYSLLWLPSLTGEGSGERPFFMHRGAKGDAPRCESQRTAVRFNLLPYGGRPGGGWRGLFTLQRYNMAIAVFECLSNFFQLFFEGFEKIVLRTAVNRKFFLSLQQKKKSTTKNNIFDYEDTNHVHACRTLCGAVYA